MKPRFFRTSSEFRVWLEKHHEGTPELLVGFYRKDSGKPSITWPEAVDQALCFGWIDGIRRSIDDISYTIRFTPRRSRSIWSSVNVKRAGELTKLGLMRPAGLEAFERRAPDRSGIYSYEQRKDPRLVRDDERRFRENTKAWDFFQSQPAWYRRTAVWWVVSAKREETRAKRLATLIEDSERGHAIRQLTRPVKSK